MAPSIIIMIKHIIHSSFSQLLVVSFWNKVVCTVTIGNIVSWKVNITWGWIFFRNANLKPPICDRWKVLTECATTCRPNLLLPSSYLVNLLEVRFIHHKIGRIHIVSQLLKQKWPGRWLKMTCWSFGWRSTVLLKRSFNHPKKIPKTCQGICLSWNNVNVGRAELWWLSAKNSCWCFTKKTHGARSGTPDETHRWGGNELGNQSFTATKKNLRNIHGVLQVRGGNAGKCGIPKALFRVQRKGSEFDCEVSRNRIVEWFDI